MERFNDITAIYIVNRKKGDSLQEALQEALLNKESLWIEVGAILASMFSMLSDSRNRAECTINFFRSQHIHSITPSSRSVNVIEDINRKLSSSACLVFPMYVL